MRNGKWIRQVAGHLNIAIERDGWTATELAHKVGIHSSSLSQVRMGYEPLRVHHVDKLLKFLPSLPKRQFKAAVLKSYTVAELKRQGITKRP